MKKYIAKNIELITTGVYILSFLLLTAALFASTDYAMRDASIIYHYAFLGVGLLIYLLGHVMLNATDKMREAAEQFLVIDIVVAVTFLLLAIRGYSNLEEIGRKKYLLSFGSIALISIIGMIILLQKDYKKLLMKAKMLHIYKGIIQHKYLAILLVFISAVFMAQSGSEPRWDGSYIFHYLQDMYLATIFNIEGLSFCGHISMAFTGLNKVLHFMIGDLFWGMTVGTYLLLIGSICCVYGILKELLTERSDFEYAFLTAIYAFSPFIIGLAGYNYWDYWVIALFPVVVFTAMRGKWVYHFVVAFIFCFIKETAIVAYGVYCMGWLLRDFAQIKSVPHLFKQKKYWGMLTVGLTWLYVYIVLPNWDGVGGFTFRLEYIWEKLKVLYILNFNWILGIVGGIAFIWLLCKDRKILADIFPILISDIAFVIFSCLFDTVNHARYIDTHIIWLNISALIGLGLIKNKRTRYICNVAILVIMIISNYKTIDPLSLLVFNRFDIGNDTMISTCTGEYLSDSMVYNQQYRYFDGALNLALEEAVHDENGIHFFPTLIERSWFFEGISTKGEIDELEMQFWDESKAKRVLVQTDDCISFPLYNITEQSNIEQILGESIGYYYSIPFVGTEIMDKIKEDMRVIDEKTFSYRGWEVTRIHFVAE